MLQSQVRGRVAVDRSAAEIELLLAANASVSLRLNPDQLLGLIQAFGQLRADLVAGQLVPSLKGAQVSAVVNPKWLVERDAVGQASVFSFQHPAFGPVGCVLPPDQVRSLTSLLSEHVDLTRVAGGKPQ